MKKLIIFLLAVFALSMTACTSGSSACKAKGYKTWYCGYERPQASYRAMLR